ncbi:MAG: prolipoprotein diacylglyceryl transferase [Isosphaeraceae bacterium]
MMKQVLFRIPSLGITVYGFGLMVVLAFYIGLILATWRARREKLDPLVMQDLAVWIVIGGLIGARLLYVVQYWGETITTIGEIFRVWEGGIVFYGSVFGGAVAFFLYRTFRAFPVLPTLDALAPSLALGLALGRIGCFLNGCCYGARCDIPWLAARFPRSSPPWLAERARGLISADAPTTLPLHPTQLYSALDGLILFALLSAFYPRRRRDGEVIGLLMLTYPVTRFLIERLRDDEAALRSGFTVSQVISLGLFGSALLFWSSLTRSPAIRQADISPSGRDSDPGRR